MPKRRASRDQPPLPRYKDPKERNRFYLLPGQGGSAHQRKQRFILRAALLVGLLVSGIFALAVWLSNRSLK